MHKGLKPEGQPRSLRSIVEKQNAKDGFPGLMPMDPSGVPASHPAATAGKYVDEADRARKSSFPAQRPERKPW